MSYNSDCKFNVFGQLINALNILTQLMISGQLAA